MVIPGVNGSVLASAYQQSKLRRRFNQGGPVKPYANLWAVSPQGDFNYQAGVNKGPLSARVTGSTNVPNLRQNFLEPSLSMNAGPANIGFTPRGVSAGIGGGNAYLQGSADYSGETASVQGGVFGQKFGVNADAFLDKSKYVDAGVTASYNVAPGLAVEGSYRYNNFEGPSQNYFLGARYNKRFEDGGRETSTEESPERMGEISITTKKSNPLMKAYRKAKSFIGSNPYTGKDSTLENAVEFFDPTGISSWDDAGRAYSEWKDSGSQLPTTGQALDMFGALPLLGKFSKLKYLSSGIKPAYKYFKWQDALNKADAIQDDVSDNPSSSFQPSYYKAGGKLQQAYMKSGGKHGGLDRWFAEKWVDVKSGKPCGRQEGEDRAYPACRPSRRVSSQTPKTSSEMSSQEKAKFKSAKTSSERIPYNHKRK